MTTAVAAPTERLSTWDRFLFEAESPSPLALLRVVWGVLATVWAISLLSDIDPFMTRGELYYGGSNAIAYWNPLEWTHWQQAPMAVCILLIVTGLTTSIGLFSRASSLIAVLCMLSLQRTNPIVMNSGDYVLRHVGVAVALGPSGLLLSLDALRARRRATAKGEELPAPRRAPWALRFLQLDIAIGYFLSMWPKLRGDTWHDGTAMGLALRITDVRRFGAPQWLFDQAVLLNVVTWGDARLRGLVPVPGVEAALAAVGARHRRPVPPRHRHLHRRRLLQLRDARLVHRLHPGGRRRSDRRPDPSAPDRLVR